MVDDEAHLDILIKQKFRREIDSGEFHFYFAKNGKHALDILNTYPDIDVIVSDISMPEMDGLSLLKLVQNNYPHIKIALMSAYGSTDDIKTGISSGSYDFIKKPIDLSELKKYLEKTALDIRQGSEDLCRTKDRIIAIKEEIEFAHKMQKSILPTNFPKTDKLQMSAYMEPSRVISGDFYDFFWLSSNKIGIVIADVSGVGPSATLLISICRNIIKTYATIENDPASCFDKVNQYIIKESKDMIFINAIYGILDTSNGEFVYTNADHIAPLVFQDKIKCYDLSLPEGIKMGRDMGYRYKNKKITLSRNQGVFFYTDGILDLSNKTGDIFGKERLMTIVNDNANRDPDTMKEKIEKYIHDFIGNKSRIYDDITFLTVKYYG